MMTLKKIKLISKSLLAGLLIIFMHGCTGGDKKPLLDQNKLATEYYQEDAQWFLIIFLSLNVQINKLEQVYYYRWKMYKAHLRNVGNNAFVDY